MINTRCGCHSTSAHKHALEPSQDMDVIQRQYRSMEDISFFRPDGATESKSIDWCLGNGFFEIEEDLWSGPWFYRKYPKAEAMHEERVKRTERIRSLCEGIRPGECDSDDYWGY